MKRVLSISEGNKSRHFLLTGENFYKMSGRCNEGLYSYLSYVYPWDVGLSEVMFMPKSQTLAGVFQTNNYSKRRTNLVARGNATSNPLTSQIKFFPAINMRCNIITAAYNGLLNTCT